jgi:hypothetical protein
MRSVEKYSDLIGIKVQLFFYVPPSCDQSGGQQKVSFEKFF